MRDTRTPDGSVIRHGASWSHDLRVSYAITRARRLSGGCAGVCSAERKWQCPGCGKRVIHRIEPPKDDAGLFSGELLRCAEAVKLPAHVTRTAWAGGACAARAARSCSI